MSNFIDYDKLGIERYKKYGLTDQEATYLNKAIKNQKAYEQDEYAQALDRRYRANSYADDKLAEEEFLKNFRKIKEKKVVTDDLFEPVQEQYLKPKGSPGIDPKYLEAIQKQRSGNKLKIVPEEGFATVEGVGAALLPFAIHYANEYTHNELNPLDIKSANEGEDELMMRINALNKQKYLDSLKK